MTSSKKDGNQTRIYRCSPASGSKGYRWQWQGRGLKYLNLPGFYKWLSSHPQDWEISISCPWFSCYLHMEFRINRFSSPQLPSGRHSDIPPLLGTDWKKAKHYYSTLLQKVGLAYHQLCQNPDRSTMFILSPTPPRSSYLPAVPMVRAASSLETVMACCYSTGQQTLNPNSGLSHATEIPTNKKYRNSSRKRPWASDLHISRSVFTSPPGSIWKLAGYLPASWKQLFNPAHTSTIHLDSKEQFLEVGGNSEQNHHLFFSSLANVW